MKLAGRAAAGFIARPDASMAGILLYGGDPMRVATKRADLVQALVGPEAEAEMRLTRLRAADLRTDPAALLDAVKAVGFFAGPRAVVIDEVSDGLAPLFANALEAWADGDAQIIAAAKGLTPRSKLRKLFGDSKSAVAIGVYEDPPTRAEIEAEAARAGLARLHPDTMADIEALAHGLSPGEFRQTLEKLALYAQGAAAPLSPADVAAVAPATIDTAIDEILFAIAGAQHRTIGPILRRLAGQGVAPVSLCIAAERHFGALHRAAAHPSGPEKGIATMRPPIFGPRRDRMIRDARAWGVDMLERALGVLIETDLALRSASHAPQMALVERAFIRLAMMPRMAR